MRMFAAVVPPPEAREHLEEFLEPRRAHAAFRWTDPDQLHVTLAFLAHVPDRALDDLVDRLGAAAARRRRFELALAGGGAFPHVVEAKVIWAGVTGVSTGDDAARAELDRLAVGARSAAVAAGVEVDGARFRPHVTVARTGRPVEATRWVRLLDAYAGPAFTVDHVALVASHLGEGRRRRPRYETVAELRLGDDPPPVVPSAASRW